MLLAIAAGFFLYQSADFNVIFTLTPYLLHENLSLFNFQVSIISAITFFMFLGAVGKSAQLGLHT